MADCHGAAAKIVFFDHEGVERFFGQINSGTLIVGGRNPRAIYNRIKVRPAPLMWQWEIFPMSCIRGRVPVLVVLWLRALTTSHCQVTTKTDPWAQVTLAVLVGLS
ncbi:hypothetical protein F4810DRAFT_636144 [Camillea tinctor]|nr:hypothetical protein F4810DRAFT_636144 [Camillea tinctor]